MFELAILYIISNMATSNLNKTDYIQKKKKKKKPVVATKLKKNCLIKQFYRHCKGTAIFLTLFYL